MPKDIDIVIVGSCVQDLVSYAPRFPRPGESVRGYNFAFGYGGKGANQAVQAARLGAKVAFVGMVGNDTFGPSTIENMKQQGIDTTHLRIADGASTGTATVTVSDEGENSIVIVQGANDQLTVAHVTQAEDIIARAKILCCQLEVPMETNIAALKLARKHQTKTIFNPAPGMPDMDVTCLQYCDIAEFLSKSTPDSLRSVDDATRMAQQIKQLGARTVIVTLGSRGCLLLKEDASAQQISCPKVVVKDTTGAGDSFVGSLAYFMCRHEALPLEEHVRRAACIASHSVQHPGTQNSYAYRKDLPGDLFQ